MNNTLRNNIRQSFVVQVVFKKDRKTELLTKGVLDRILTNNINYPKHIKVMLTADN